MAELGRVDAVCNLLCVEPGNLLALAGEVFSTVYHLRDYENVQTDWSTGDVHENRSAAGPNSLFKQAAWHFQTKGVPGWLWLEPDAIPCCKDWLTEIDREYVNSRKAFMGAFVRGVDANGQPVPDHMSGVGVYHKDTTGLPKKMWCTHVPFDLVEPKEVNPFAHWTKRIIHSFRAPPFMSMADLDERAPKGTVLYHSCKDGSIIPFLRERIFGVTLTADGPPERPQETKSAATDVNHQPAGVALGNGGPSTRVELVAKAPKTWIDSVRTLMRALEKMGDTPVRRTQIQSELKKVKLIPQRLRK